MRSACEKYHSQIMNTFKAAQKREQQKQQYTAQTILHSHRTGVAPNQQLIKMRQIIGPTLCQTFLARRAFTRRQRSKEVRKGSHGMRYDDTICSDFNCVKNRL